MKWAILVLFIIGLAFVLWGIVGYRIDYKKGQSADVKMGNGVLIFIGCAIWVLDLLVLIFTVIIDSRLA